MRLAVDTIFFSHPYSGITRVWETILTNLQPTNLQKLDIPECNDTINYEIILLIRGNSNNVSNVILDKLKNISFEKITINEFNYFAMYKDVDYLNFICKQYNIDYFISTYYTYCTSIPNIILIHDMIPEIFKLPKSLMWQQKDLAIKNASHFITISNTTTKDLIKFYPHINNKQNQYNITTIYNSISQDSTISNSQHKQSIDKLFNGVLPKKYIFALASNNEHYKNTKLITDFAKKYSLQLSQNFNTQIPIIFLIKQNLPNNHIFSNGVLYITNVSDTVLHMLYKNALCFISPSLYEGFGLPIFEAFIHKTPVIALDIPIYQELAVNAINYIDNDIDKLFEKVGSIVKHIDVLGNNIIKKVETGYEIVKKYTLDRQILAYHKFFNSLEQTSKSTNANTNAFLNIVLQSYNETMLERRVELEYCIKANLDNPYIAKIHDFGYQPENYLPEYILKHPKYIHSKFSNNHTGSNKTDSNKWLTYETAFKYVNNNDNIRKYGEYWGIINCDIFLDDQSNWPLIRGQLNNDFIFAQSRHELKQASTIGEKIYELDINFSRLYHANTQDGWFFKAPIKLHSSNLNNILPDLEKRLSVNFELGMLGCDNAIADRLVQSGYKIINQPATYKIIHYDIAKGKNSTNYLEKHSSETQKKKDKPKNTHPERIGSYLVPNYDQIINMGQNGEIDLLGFINSIGGIGNISNWEKYKIISELLSSRIIINNPD